uniref:Methyltransferase type 11 domain-containing protein n=1 Tax=Polytomella parva TaxID=51329 RepID=A0A7S0UWG5_9CHLO|nr:predicted protein [Polytomella parva]|eukprot:CAMPEP_0175074704 /NCGR_PEP_ID=MMETSP0052_2-20121109/21485_1 /TAXON_ID=51329 ORGANISM="Polytomella parva, Strain SAG 63-3" /NCGR_SAMPLE_ID=MMETSP0052_2 /ASSEMBLY_ACC=CAM_ASM_000194 /LENGTH=337 /DNA_ID=CAMNT_0016343093 /DNA_START=45 /DNA_END=1058 /DNA_ORIENTATION=-
MAHDLVVAAASAAATSFFLLHVLPKLPKFPQLPSPHADLDERSTTSSAGGGASAYETKKAVEEYLMFHYGAAEDILPYKTGPHSALDFMSRCALLCERHCEALQDFTGDSVDPTTAIDMGCAVGRGTFELSRGFQRVLGVDFSQHFIDAAERMQKEGQLPYSYVLEGDIRRTAVAAIPEDIIRHRCQFTVGDACAVPETWGPVDCVLAANLLCRLPDPKKFLDRCRTLIKPGGILVLVSPYSWLAGWTSKEKWLGGYLRADDQQPQFTRNTIIDYLTKSVGNTVEHGVGEEGDEVQGDFELIESGVEMPFLIREHARKFQWGCSEGMVFKRRKAHSK